MSDLERAALEELARRELARRHLLDFTLYTFPGYRASWHHEVIADHLDRVALPKGHPRRIPRLMVFCPPGMGKSELVSRRFPAWLLGRDPRTRIVATSYTASLAATMGTAVRSIVGSEAFARVFPEVVLEGKETELAFDVRGKAHHDQSYYGVGVGGGLSGRRFDVAVIDDPVKAREDAESKPYRDRLEAWYTSVLRTRRADLSADGSAIVLVLTRWHEDDLAGRLLEAASKGRGDPWTVLWLPALRELDSPYPVPVEAVDPREEGEPLWPERQPLEDLELTRSISSRDWTSLYQQRPVPAAGGLFRREWLRYFDRTDERGAPAVEWLDGEARVRRYRVEALRRFVVVDLAASTRETADYTVAQVWGQVPGSGELLLLDQDRRRLEGPDQVPALRALLERWRAGVAWVERVGYQLAFVQHARAAGLPVRELVADRDKVARSFPAQALAEGGRILLPRGAPWLGDLEAELLAFPQGAHDDQVDALAYAALVAASWSGPPAPPPVLEEDGRRAYADELVDAFPTLADLEA